MKTFLDREMAERVRDFAGTPCYAYDEATLKANAAATLAFPNAYGLRVRYAMKALPNGNILRLFNGLGLSFDASSVHEARRAKAAGIAGDRISLSSQEFPDDDGLRELLQRGVSVNLCSLHQLESYGRVAPRSEVGIRFNPGLGSGGTQRTNVGGPASSFGIWHEKEDEVRRRADELGLTVVRIHSHIGSGSDPAVWTRVVSLTLDLARRFQSVTTVNLGGGFKVGRMPNEQTTDLQKIGEPMKAEFEAFAQETGRKLKLEIEPGTYLVATAGVVVATVQDATDTGEEGYRFIKLDTGMTENLRPSLYGAQHFMELYPQDGEERESREQLVVGHCCESGDILTPRPGDSEGLQPREFPIPKVGDLFAIHASGAYCAAMPAKNYNSFPESPEVLIRENGQLELMRRRQTLEQVLANELSVDL